jgi:hypothetical protein
LHIIQGDTTAFFGGFQASIDGGKSFFVDLNFVGFGLGEFPVSHDFTLAH